MSTFYWDPSSAFPLFFLLLTYLSPSHLTSSYFFHSVFSLISTSKVFFFFFHHAVCILVCLFVFCFVYSSDSLDELASLVEKLFSPVVNKNIPVPEFPEHPYSDNELQVSHLMLSLPPLSHCLALCPAILTPKWTMPGSLIWIPHGECTVTPDIFHLRCGTGLASFPGHSQIFHSCEMKSGSGLGTRLVLDYPNLIPRPSLKSLEWG